LSIPGIATEGPRKIITMDLNDARRMGKQPYEAVREQFGQLGERVIERHWDEGAPVRQGYRRFLGTLDELAGRLLDDDEIAQRGQDLLRESEAAGAEGTAEAGEAGAAGGAGAAGAAQGPDGATGATAAGGEAGDETGDETGDSVWTRASDEADDRAAEQVRRTEEARRAEAARSADEAALGESWAAGNARVAGETSETAEAPGAGEAERTVDVVFSLPAETQADRVALCGDFNDWATEGISLARGDDRTWRVTVSLVPGSYRYKFLLDGETWENGPDADRLEENAYGTLDSVIEVR
jgi:AMP-activated protein kinase-like protein